MKITVLGRITQGSDGVYRFPLIVGAGQSVRAVPLDLDASYQPDSLEPTRPLMQNFFPWDGPWAYRGIAVDVKGGNELSLEEIRLKIKHAVLRRDKAFERMRREIEAFENVEQADMARRERISDSVRLFVWQRDQGKCVKCGSAEKLEFDHIIPVVKGGSNTERNVQLLCEQCNRAKGSSI
ncbi:MAG: HNH endonuclease [Nitrospira sp.]|nr:HNH endonuclease [Nitrospira sp.]